MSFRLSLPLSVLVCREAFAPVGREQLAARGSDAPRSPNPRPVRSYLDEILGRGPEAEPPAPDNPPPR